MENRVFFKRLAAWVVLGAAFFVSGCNSLSAHNNYLRPADFARKLQADGFQVTAARQLDYRPLAAADAIELTVNGANIGVYKYDINNKANRARLEKIAKDKKVFFMGFPYPVYEVSGSFIVVGLDKHKDKKRILESLRNFR